MVVHNDEAVITTCRLNDFILGVKDQVASGPPVGHEHDVRVDGTYEVVIDLSEELRVVPAHQNVDDGLNHIYYETADHEGQKDEY